MIKSSQANGVLTLTLARSPVNAFNEEMVSVLLQAVMTVERQRQARVVHFRSEEKVFCAGADLKLMRECFGGAQGVDRLLTHVRQMQHLFNCIEQLPQITIAEVGGAALGGGLELALSCDLRVVAEDANLGLPEIKLGLIPGAGGTQRLTRQCGPVVARRMILSGEAVSGSESVKLGLAQWAHPRSQLRTATEDLARRLSELPGDAIAACKRCLSVADEQPRAGFEMELLETRELLGNSDETTKRIRAFLKNKDGK